MREYWNKPEASRRFQPSDDAAERLLYTGDLFRQDDQGFFYFVGRQDDIIKSRGEKVAPKEIENVLYELEGVLETCVVGEADPLLGEAIKALVVPCSALDRLSLSERVTTICLPSESNSTFTFA